MNAADKPLADGWLRESSPQFGPLSPESAQSFPDFLIISPPKTGSTWLAANLRCHPEIFIPEVKEVKYFSSYYKWLDLDWYLGQFRDGAGRRKGEASPSYSLLPCRTIRQIHSLRPDLRLIFLMREPISRAWSHAKHSYSYKETNFQGYSGKFEAIAEKTWRDNFTHPWPLSSGDYLGQLRRWLSVFPQNQVYLGFFESIQHNPQALLGELFEFLGVSPDVDFDSFRLSEKIMSGRTGEIPPPLKSYLHAVLQSRTWELSQFLKERFNLSLPPEWKESLVMPDGSALLAWRDDLRAVYDREFDDDYLTGLLETETLSTPRLVLLNYRGYNIVFYRRQFYALSQTLGPLAVETLSEAQLEDLQTCATCVIAGSMAEVKAQVDQRIYASLQPILVEEGYRGFNIVSFGEKYYAIRSGEGAFAVESATAGRYRELFQSGTVDNLKVQIDKLAPPALPELVEEGYCGFNIVSYDGAWYGLEQAEGAFDPAKVEKQQYVRCIRSTSKEELKEILRTEHSKAEAERAARLLLPQLVEEDYRGFNIISCNGEYYGIRPGEGAFAIESVKARTYKELFHGATLDGLKAEMDKAAPAPLPQLVEEGYCGFNIILYDGTWYGLAQGEGPFDPAKVDKCQSFRSTSKEELKRILKARRA